MRAAALEGRGEAAGSFGRRLWVRALRFGSVNTLGCNYFFRVGDIRFPDSRTIVFGIAFKFTGATTGPEQSKVPQKMCAKEERNFLKMRVEIFSAGPKIWVLAPECANTYVNVHDAFWSAPCLGGGSLEHWRI